jgi:spermidine synthase
MAKDKQNQPTTYFTEKSGAGRAIRVSQARGKVHIGVIGLGIGVVATYGNVGDRFRFYEINPDVVYAAKEYFSFLGDSKAQIDIILGDARLSLEREKDQNFDVLMIDAFSSDSIPVHLLTKQAMSVYLRHLSSSGLLVFHISNRHLDLRPVVNELAKHHNLHSRTIRTNANPSELVADSTYMVLASNSLFFENDMFSDIPLKDSVPIPKGDLWTDDYSNVFALLRW